MNITDQQKARLTQFCASDIHVILKGIVRDIVERSWKMRKSGKTAAETHGMVRYAEGMEAGAQEILNIINKLTT